MKFSHKLKRIIELDNKLNSSKNKLNEYVVYQFLTDKGYSIDENLKSIAVDQEKERLEYETLLSELEPIENFRHIVYSIAREHGETLDKLSERLVIEKNALESLCKQNIPLTKEQFDIFCNYFNLEQNKFKWEQRYTTS